MDPLKNFEKRGGVDHNGAGTGPGHTCTPVCLPAYRQLSNALAESEKERERLREAWDVWTEHNARRHGCDWGYTERPDGQALSPDSQEKREE